MKEVQAPANAFEWRRYVIEEAARRGDKPTKDAGNTARKRSIASTKAIERIRETSMPAYGTVFINDKTAKMIAMKPKTFIIHSRKKNG